MFKRRDNCRLDTVSRILFFGTNLTLKSHTSRVPRSVVPPLGAWMGGREGVGGGGVRGRVAGGIKLF